MTIGLLQYSNCGIQSHIVNVFFNIRSKGRLHSPPLTESNVVSFNLDAPTHPPMHQGCKWIRCTCLYGYRHAYGVFDIRYVHIIIIHPRVLLVCSRGMREARVGFPRSVCICTGHMQGLFTPNFYHLPSYTQESY